MDVGIHYKGWSREDAVDFLKNNAPLAEHDINSEIDRYTAWPGQALAYKVGELRIKSLRRKAEDRLGEAFDVREFHDVVLSNGSIPLDLLEEKVDDWLAFIAQASCQEIESSQEAPAARIDGRPNP